MDREGWRELLVGQSSTSTVPGLRDDNDDEF